MRKEFFFTHMPKVAVKEEERNERVKEQQDLHKAGLSFASRLAISHYLEEGLEGFDLEERLRFFSTLHEIGFSLRENELSFSPVTVTELEDLLKETFSLENIYKLDECYLEGLLRGENILEKEFELKGETYTLNELLTLFTIHAKGISIGDTPNLMLLLAAKKALLGSFLAEENLFSLRYGEKEIYDISRLY